MICAWAATTDEELQLIGDILRVLSDHPDFEAATLGPSFLPSEAVHLLLINPPIEEQARIWSAFGFKRFKLSLYYRARSVLIRSNRRHLETLVQTPELDARLLRAPASGPAPGEVP
jgi:Pvc16 N-terminal domain